MRNSKVYTILSIPVFVLLHIFTAMIVMLLLFLSYLKFKKALRPIIFFWARGIFYVLGKKLNVFGIENIKQDKKYIVVANHTSLFDIPAIMNVFPEISWFGKERLLRVPLFGTILKMTDYVPMKEANYQNTKEMLGKLIEKTQARSIGIFPEGTRTTTGQMNRFHRGFIYLLRTTKLNILPVTLNGFYSLKPKNLFYINFSANIDVIVHKEIRYEDLKEKTDNEIIDQVRNTIESLYRK